MDVRPQGGALEGLIADVQRFSVHDGPGIRTTVFLKGCNLRCAWCHNPETLSHQPEILSRPDLCIGCGGCDEGCFSGARVLCGARRGVSDVLGEVLADRPYYGPEGGLTVSGGEPACQPEFTLALLQACREAGIHTVMESNFSLEEGVMRLLWRACDMVLADLKLWDAQAHRRWTGADNRRILSNLSRCAQDGVPIRLHTPVVTGVNDTAAEIGAIADFARTLPTLECYELLPYHPLGLSKGRVAGYEPMRFETPPAHRMRELARTALARGIPVRVAGQAIEQEENES